MATRTQKIKLGVFLVFSAAVITGLLAVFLGVGLTPGARYNVFVKDAEGLDVTVPVKLRGVRVGRVTELELVDDGAPSVRVEIEVDDDAPIPADARAYLEFAGVSGLKLINIRGGTAESPVLPPGGTIELGETTLEKLGNQSEELLARASKVLDTTDRLLTSLNRTTEKLNPERLDETLKETQKLVKELGRTAAQLDKIVTETREPLRQTLLAAHATLEQVDGMGQRTDAVLENLNLTILDLRGVVRENDGDFRATLDNLRHASKI
jgi:phospholipid/cholesterol/gamma-HCH transport system substrate-binding protein